MEAPFGCQCQLSGNSRCGGGGGLPGWRAVPGAELGTQGGVPGGMCNPHSKSFLGMAAEVAKDVN